MFRLYANAIRFGAAVALILIAVVALSPVRTGAAEPGVYTPSVSGGKFLALGLGKSVVIDLPSDAKDVLVANPAIANAVVRSARRAYLTRRASSKKAGPNGPRCVVSVRTVRWD